MKTTRKQSSQSSNQANHGSDNGEEGGIMRHLIHNAILICVLILACSIESYSRPTNQDSVLFADFLGNALSPVAYEGKADTFRMDTYNSSVGFDSLIIDSIHIVSYSAGILPVVTFRFKSEAPWGSSGPKVFDTICNLTNTSSITNSTGKFMVANDVAGGKGSITDVHIESQSPNTLKYDSLYAEIRFVARRIFFSGNQVPSIVIYDTLLVKGIQNSQTSVINSRKLPTNSIRIKPDGILPEEVDLFGRRITNKSNYLKSHILLQKSNSQEGRLIFN